MKKLRCFFELFFSLSVVVFFSVSLLFLFLRHSLSTLFLSFLSRSLLDNREEEEDKNKKTNEEGDGSRR